jgi:hypothetical protein
MINFPCGLLTRSRHPSRANDEIITNSECGNLEAELSKIIAVMSFASRGGGQPRNISGSRADIYYSVLKRMATYLMKISHFYIRVIFRSNILSSRQRSWSHSHAVYLAQKTRDKVTFSLCLINQAGARGIVVIKVLCYKPDGRGFENWWGECIFTIYPILSATVGSGVHSTSNRNVYQKHKNYVSGKKSGASA